MSRKRKSGNNTTANQWVYVLWNFPYVWTCKVGIGGNLFRRTRQIGKENKGIDIIIFALPIWFAYDTEQAIHRAFSAFRDNSFKGTGHTERFSVIVAPFAILIIIIMFVFQHGILMAIAFFIIWSLAGAPKLGINYF